MDFPNAQLPSLIPLQNSFTADGVEEALRDIFIDVFEQMLAEQVFDINVIGVGHLGSMDLIRRLVNADGLALVDGEREETATRYLYKAWKARNRNGRGLFFLETYLQLLYPNSFAVEQMAQAKSGSYPHQLSPLSRADSTKYSTSRIRIALDAYKATWENVLKMEPILRSIIPARLVLYFVLMTTWRRANYIGSAMLNGCITTVYPAASQPTEWNGTNHIGLAMTETSIITIYPKVA